MFHRFKTDCLTTGDANETDIVTTLHFAELDTPRAVPRSIYFITNSNCYELIEPMKNQKSKRFAGFREHD